MFKDCQEWRKTVEGVGIDELYRTLDPFDVSFFLRYVSASVVQVLIFNVNSIPSATESSRVGQCGSTRCVHYPT